MTTAASHEPPTVTAARVGCRFCETPEVVDPDAIDLKHACDRCLHTRTDDAIWDHDYAILCHLWLTRRYLELQGEQITASLQGAIVERITAIGQDPTNVTGF